MYTDPDTEQKLLEMLGHLLKELACVKKELWPEYAKDIIQEYLEKYA